MSINRNGYTIVFAGVGLAVLGFALFVFSQSIQGVQSAAVGDTEVAGVETTPPISGGIPSQTAAAAGFEEETRLLNQIFEINSIKLDTNFFQSSVFLSLVDFSQTITAQPVGRLDPFSPVDMRSVRNTTE